MRPSAWSDKLAAISFWGLNVGMMLMLVLNIFPAGVIQMIASYRHGFWYARSYEFIHSHLFQSLPCLLVDI
jgi:nitric oxide reductase subunit B